MKRRDNTMREAYAQSQRQQVVQELQWRDWTGVLLAQALAAIEQKLAAGDIAVYDGTDVESALVGAAEDALGQREPVGDEAADDFSDFLEGV
ncbi:MAG TPA: hypothetical protein ENJ56_02880 [Anaerolineae bacterium]|nr:hypothetical protein [Anaerolineae bacterium]